MPSGKHGTLPSPPSDVPELLPLESGVQNTSGNAISGREASKPLLLLPPLPPLLELAVASLPAPLLLLLPVPELPPLLPLLEPPSSPAKPPVLAPEPPQPAAMAPTHAAASPKPSHLLTDPACHRCMRNQRKLMM